MKIKANFDLLAEKAREKFPDLRLFLGSELYCEPGRVIQWVEDGQALSKLYPVKRTPQRVTLNLTSPVYGR